MHGNNTSKNVLISDIKLIDLYPEYERAIWLIITSLCQSWTSCYFMRELREAYLLAISLPKRPKTCKQFKANVNLESHTLKQTIKFANKERENKNGKISLNILCLKQQ